MIRRASSLATLVAASLAFAGALSSLAPSDARACGGGFFPSEPVPGMIESASVVTDHRMAVSITPTMTTLWDQIEYAGDPSEFAWVLPVRGGVTVGVGSDDFLTALDKETAPEIVAPRRRCARPNNGGCGGSNTEGCASSAEDSTEFGFEDGFQEDSGVFVTGRQLVGPYAAVTVHGDDEGAILGFLRGNKFNVPTTIQPTLSKFVTEGFDFVVVRLRRKAGAHAMVPIRVSWKGATLSLPLRMVQAGVSANVGIKLFVISDRRYTAANYPTFSVDPSGLTWDFPAQKSDYVAIRDQMAAGFDGRAFSLEASLEVPRTSLPAIKPDQPLPSSGDAGVDTAPEDTADGGDAATDDAAEAATDAAPEEVETDAVPRPEYDGGAGPEIDPYDSDLNIAYGTFQLRRVTRLRGNLPAKYLDQDLVLALDANQAVLPRKVQVDRATSAPVCPGTASIAGDEKDLPIRASIAIVLGALGAVLARRASRRG